VNTRQPKLKQGTLTLAITGALAVMAQAATAQVVISTLTNGPYSWSTGDLTVESTGSIIYSRYSSAAVNVSGNVGTLTNSGVISNSTTAGIDNRGTIGTVINNGTIIGGYNAGIIN
jgi:hypothetical protein